MKHIQYSVALLFLMLSAQPSSGQSSHSVSHNNVALGLNHRNADSSLVSRLNVGLANNVDSLRGLQLGLTTANVNRDARGVNIGLLGTLTRGDMIGLQLAGTGNGVAGTTKGVQIAPFTNYATVLRGMQLGGIINIAAQPVKGVQLAGGANVANGIADGVQLSALVNVSSGRMRGLQISGYNYADTLNGCQAGFINVAAEHTNGWQLGIFNYSRDTTAHKIGLVNVNPKTKIDLLAFLGTTSIFNGAIRFRNRSTYSIIGAGTHYMGLDDHFSGALYYRLGQYFQLSPRWSVSGDVGYYHIETFEENSRTKPKRLY